MGMEYSSVKGKSVPSVSGGRKLQEKNLRNFKLDFPYKIRKSLGDSSTAVIFGFFPVMRTHILYFGHSWT